MWKERTMKKRISYILYGFLIVVSFAGCATYGVRLDSTREWIEGKPFPVNLTISRPEKISNVVLHYSFNGAARKSINMTQSGNYYSHTIPGPEVVAGTLRYEITYNYKDKGKSSGSVSVRILTIEEARRKYAGELSARISFSPPSQVPFNRDARLVVKVSSHKSSTRTTFYYRTAEQSSFREVVLGNQNGSFTAVIPQNEIQAGYNTYYFSVTEEHPDVGELQVFVKGRDSGNPFRFDILTLEELKEAIAGELYASVSHTVPRDVYATRDLQLELTVNYPSSGFAREFSMNALSVELFHRSPSTRFKGGVMLRSGNSFSYTVAASDLQQGYNTYYFVISDEMEDMGPVSVQYPADGELFSYNILSIEQIRALKTKALYERIVHRPVVEADGITDLYINLNVRGAKTYTNAVLFFKRPTTSEYKSVQMTREGEAFTGAISIDEQQRGYTQYYFVVSETDSEVGTISATYPENGPQSPIQYTVLDINELKTRLEAELRARVTHRPVATASEGSDLELSVNVAEVKAGTEVYFYHRKPGETSYRQTRLQGSGPQYVMVLPKQDIRSGYSQYFFEVKEPHSYFGYIEATAGTPTAPYEFEISKLKNAILDGIDFIPLSDVEYGVPVIAAITLNNNPEGTRVNLRYRLADDTLDYLSVEMGQSENVYTATLSPALLQKSGRVDYYFSIRTGQDEFTYPDESIIPLYFSVKEQLVEAVGDESVFGSTGRSEDNMLEGRIFQLEANTNKLPQNMHRDYESLVVLFTRRLDIPARSFDEGFPGLQDVFEWFGIQYRGVITVRESGLYRFRLLSDDGSKLFIDSVLIIDNDGTHVPRSKSGEIYLSPGTYPIRVDYFQGPKYKIALQLFATKPGGEEQLFDLQDFE
jgi:hypothetical protein